MGLRVVTGGRPAGVANVAAGVASVAVAPADQRVGRVDGAGFEVGYVAADGVEHRVELAGAWPVRFESCRPARRFPQYKGQRHFPGRWWCATTGGHVGYESWLERDHLMLLDFDPGVVAVASQPLWLFWTSDAGRPRSHAPDYFVRRADGGAEVLDCRAAERIGPRDAAKFDATRLACGQLGWGYRIGGALDAVRVANVRWLAGYRHPRHAVADVAVDARKLFGTPAGLFEGARALGDPIAVLPVLFHLLWSGTLVADLTVPLHPDTIVSTAEVA